MNRTELILELFAPDENGISRWVSKNELVGRYSSLYPTNGNQWMRNRGLKHLKLEKETIDGVIHWRFNGFEENQKSNRPIKKEIRDELSKRPCAHTGFSGTKNNPIVIDHKNGRYNDEDVLNTKTQKLEDFQPFCNQANLQKRTYCNIVCLKTAIRFDAKILGYDVSYIEGGEKYEGTCVGCYWADCIKFKKIVSNINKTND
jgi:hypothetical protein